MRKTDFLLLSQLFAIILLSIVGCNPAEQPPQSEDSGHAPDVVEPISTGPRVEPTPFSEATPGATAELESPDLPSPTGTAVPTTAPAIILPTASPALNSAASGLAIRQPSFAELDSYLQTAQVGLFSAGEPAGSSAITLAELPNPTPIPDPRTQIEYLDVNGDGEADLVLLFAEPFMWGVNYIVIMLWQGTQYGTPFAIVENTKLNGGVAYEQADWTGDGIPELIWQSETGTSGTGYGESTWRQYVIHCQAECSVIWHGVRAVVWTSNSFYIGRGVQLTEIMPDPANGQLLTNTEGFSLPYIAGDQSAPWRVEAAQTAVYQWDGAMYALVTTETTQEAYGIESMQVLSDSVGNLTATVSYEFVPADEARFDAFICHLQVDGAVQGEPFTCNPYFTQVEWLNVLGEERAEIVVSTLHETNAWLHIWQAEGAHFSLIASVSGDLINSAWPPIQLQNLDDDPELEIVAATLTEATDQFCFAYPDPSGEDVQNCWTEFRGGHIFLDWQHDPWELQN